MASIKRIIRPKRLAELLGVSLSTAWRLAKSHGFPRPIKLSAQAVGFDLAEVEFWLEERKQARKEARA